MKIPSLSSTYTKISPQTSQIKHYNVKLKVIYIFKSSSRFPSVFQAQEYLLSSINNDICVECAMFCRYFYLFGVLVSTLSMMQ